MSTVTKERRGKSEFEQAENPPTHKDDPILNVSDVGRQLGKSPQTITRWIQDGLLVGFRQPSGLWGVRKSQVNKFLGGSALSKRVE